MYRQKYTHAMFVSITIQAKWLSSCTTSTSLNVWIIVLWWKESVDMYIIYILCTVIQRHYVRPNGRNNRTVHIGHN